MEGYLKSAQYTITKNWTYWAGFCEIHVQKQVVERMVGSVVQITDMLINILWPHINPDDYIYKNFLLLPVLCPLSSPTQLLIILLYGAKLYKWAWIVLVINNLPVTIWCDCKVETSVVLRVNFYNFFIYNKYNFFFSLIAQLWISFTTQSSGAALKLLHKLIYKNTGCIVLY